MAEDKNQLILKKENGDILTTPIKLWKNQVLTITATTKLSDCVVESTSTSVKAELISQSKIENDDYLLTIKLTGLEIVEGATIKITGSYEYPVDVNAIQVKVSEVHKLEVITNGKEFDYEITSGSEFITINKLTDCLNITGVAAGEATIVIKTTSDTGEAVNNTINISVTAE